MTNYSVKNVDEYIANSAQEAQPHLKEIRAVIKSAVPGIEEKISWGKPYYKHNGFLAGFDAMKKHISFEIWTDEFTAKERKLLEQNGYKAGKRTFQIRYDQEVPKEIIKAMVHSQAEKNEKNNG